MSSGQNVDPVAISREFGKRVHERRAASGRSRRAICTEVKGAGAALCERQLVRIEEQEAPPQRVDLVLALASVFGCTAADLIPELARQE